MDAGQPLPASGTLASAAIDGSGLEHFAARTRDAAP